MTTPTLALVHHLRWTREPHRRYFVACGKEDFHSGAQQTSLRWANVNCPECLKHKADSAGPLRRENARLIERVVELEAEVRVLQRLLAEERSAR